MRGGEGCHAAPSFRPPNPGLIIIFRKQKEVNMERERIRQNILKLFN